MRSILAVRATLTALAAAYLISGRDLVLAQPEQTRAAVEDQRILPYAAPQQRVDVGGRRLNLHCAGAGAPSVILMAGISSWSPVWYKTQPVIAQRTRTCAFDRAGFGFSDPAPRPQSLSDVVDDLHAALNAGHIPGPYVLVGHSFGGIEARVYAQRWPKEVVGMVLADTSPAGEGFIDADQPGVDEVAGIEHYTATKLYCAALLAHQPFEPSKSEFKDCLKALPGDTPAEFRRIWPQFFTAYYFTDEVALMASLYTHRYDSVDRLSLGAMPLIVLSPEDSWGDGTPAGAQFSRSYSKRWIAMHEALARLSTRGMHRYIEGSSHAIQLDKPQAVTDAVADVLRQIQAGASP